MQVAFNPPPTPLQELCSPMLDKAGVQLLVKRDDLLHPEIGGNKWRKLKYNLLEAKARQTELLVSFGGAYSNHIAALAAAGAKFRFATAGFIRGEEHLPLNPTLSQAVANGMRLYYINRESYRHKTEASFLDELTSHLGPNIYVLPEGGSNDLAVKGCAEVIAEINEPWHYLCCPVGSGGSMAGLISGAASKGTILGFPALKGGDFLTPEIEGLQASFSGQVYGNWQLITDYHCGGYAKVQPELVAFINNFKADFSIQLEPVYTGKMMLGIFDLIKKDYFPKGSSIIAWHTGGLQGLAGMRERGVAV